MYMYTSCFTHLEAGLFYEVEAGGHHSDVEAVDEILEFLGHGRGEGVDPGLHDWLPAQHLRLHVHHATARHLVSV